MSTTPAEPGGYAPPPYQVTTWTTLGVSAVLVLVLMSVRFSQTPDSPRPGDLQPMAPDGELVLLDRPEMDDEYWPCDDCHEGEDTNVEVREMDDEHDEMEFGHGTTWCLDCHDVNEREKLHLAGGTLVDFDDSWRLCTQCHGGKLDDWRAGVHGKRTGSWRGDREYRPCVTCHNPHSPTFEPIAPKPGPARPGPDPHAVEVAEQGDTEGASSHE